MAKNTIAGVFLLRMRSALWMAVRALPLVVLLWLSPLRDGEKRGRASYRSIASDRWGREWARAGFPAAFFGGLLKSLKVMAIHSGLTADVDNPGVTQELVVFVMLLNKRHVGL